MVKSGFCSFQDYIFKVLIENTANSSLLLPTQLQFGV